MKVRALRLGFVLVVVGVGAIAGCSGDSTGAPPDFGTGGRDLGGGAGGAGGVGGGGAGGGGAGGRGAGGGGRRGRRRGRRGGRRRDGHGRRWDRRARRHARIRFLLVVRADRSAAGLDQH